MEKPFIKLFHTPNSGYFYDVGKNEIIRIPENVYQHLSCVIKGTAELGQPDDEEICEMIESFKEMGYLSTRRPRKIQHSATAMIPLLLDRCIDKITLQLTQDCNFRCKYCIYAENKNLKQRSHANKYMSLETAQRAILFYRDHAIDSNIYNVGFYGGEPLLQWELLKEIVRFAERELSGKLLTFSITTNASLLTDPKASFLEEHDVSVLVSLDGIKTVNDANRVNQTGNGTTDVVLKNIRMIRDRHPKLYEKLRISSVIDPETDVALFGQYPCELDGLPLSSYTINIEDSTEHDVVIPFELHQTMENEVFLAYLSEFGLYSHDVSPYGYGQVEGIKNSMSMMKPSYGIDDTMAPGGPCVPGKSRLFISVSGQLYPCERVNETDAYCIGDLENGFDYEKAKRILNVGSITESKCKNCWAMRHCAICGKYFDYSQASAATEKLKYCESIQRATQNKFRAMIMLSEMETIYKNIIKT